MRGHLQGIWVKYIYEGHWVKVKATTAKKMQNSLFPQCKTSVSNNFGSIEDRAVKFACSMGFSDMADWMTWEPSLSRDQKYMHLWVVCLRWEGCLVLNIWFTLLSVYHIVSVTVFQILYYVADMNLRIHLLQSQQSHNKLLLTFHQNCGWRLVMLQYSHHCKALK